MTNGPGYILPPIAVSESRRSEKSQASKDRVGQWDNEDIGSFKPERWLARDYEGNFSFKANAGPFLSFGAGPRACYGRKLACLQLKLFISLLIWNFDVSDPGSAELSSFEAEDQLAHRPKVVYLNLTPVERSS